MEEDSTKSSLLKAAVSLFGSHGFSGASVRQIADAADTNIGAIKYHFGSKEGLWQAVVSFLFAELVSQISRDAADWPSLSPRDRVINATRNYIRFCARYPQLNRIILSETIENGDRMHWLAENHVRMFVEGSAEWMDLAKVEGVYPGDIPTLNLVFIAMSVSQYLFLMAPYVDHAFGIDVFDESQIEAHADAVIKLLITRPER